VGKPKLVEEPISVRSSPQKSIPLEITRKVVTDEWRGWAPQHPELTGLAACIAFHAWLQESQPRLLKAGDFGGRNRFSVIGEWISEGHGGVSGA
jgi:hypothetical protein